MTAQGQSSVFVDRRSLVPSAPQAGIRVTMIGRLQSTDGGIGANPFTQRNSEGIS
jgi:hypothetical protein